MTTHPQEGFGPDSSLADDQWATHRAELHAVIGGAEYPWYAALWADDSLDVAATLENVMTGAPAFDAGEPGDVETSMRITMGLFGVSICHGRPLPAGTVTELRLSGEATTAVPLTPTRAPVTVTIETSVGPLLGFPIRHDPATGRFLPEGASGGAKVITAAEARGNSRPVSAAEFAALSEQGRAMLEGLASSPPAGLDQHWDRIVSDAHAAVQESWGGVTIDSHTGKAFTSDGELYALTVKAPGQHSVSIPENADAAHFAAAMTEARRRFDTQLRREHHYLGVFHDDDGHIIDIDPVLVVSSPAEVDAVGAYTHAVGGAYHFATGNGYFPPHVAEQIAAAMNLANTAPKAPIAKFFAEGRDPNRPLFTETPPMSAAATTMAFPVRHNPADGRFLPEGASGGAPGSARSMTPTEAEAYYADWAKGLSADESAVVRDYTDKAKAADLNWGLRDGTIDRARLEVASKLCLTLAKAPALLPPPVKVNRGVVGAFADTMLAMKVGQTFTERGFTSTDVSSPYQGVNLEIHVPPGVRAAYLGGVSLHGPDVERELLLGQGVTYRVREHRPGRAGQPPTVVLDVAHQAPPIVIDLPPQSSDVPPVQAGALKYSDAWAAKELAMADRNDDRFAWGEGEVELNVTGTLLVDGAEFAPMSWWPSIDPALALAKSRDVAELADVGVFIETNEATLGQGELKAVPSA